MKSLTQIKSRLAELEATIEQGRTHWIAAGKALIEIRDEQLYTVTHDDFWSYCAERLGWKRRNAETVIQSYNAFTAVGETAQNFAQSASAVRELARVPAEKREEVLAAAGDKPTAKSIRQAAKVTLAEASEPTSRYEEEPARVMQHPALSGIDTSKLDADEETEFGLSQIVDQLHEIEERIRSSKLTGKELIQLSREIFNLSERVNRLWKAKL